MNDTIVKRNENFNLIKGLACIGVVFIHITFPGKIGEVISKIFQFAVPIFFMIAGYFSYLKDEPVIKRRFKKIFNIFLIGYTVFLVYNLAVQFYNRNIIEWILQNYNWKTPIKYFVFCTIDFAIPLWYLIAQLEIYALWLLLVKKGLEEKIIKILPFLFICSIIWTIICETKEFPWFWKINFLFRGLPWFLFGYYIHSKQNTERKKNFYITIMLFFAGLFISVIPIIFSTKINFSYAGIVLYSISIFLICLMLKDKSRVRILEFIGDKLSLNIYIFHVPIAGVFNFFCNSILKLKMDFGLIIWIRPIIVLTMTILFSFVLEYCKICMNRKKA